MLLGLESNYPEHTYRVLDLEAVMITRDVRWLNKNYGEYYGNISYKKR
jgi:hypothetical protein